MTQVVAYELEEQAGPASRTTAAGKRRRRGDALPWVLPLLALGLWALAAQRQWAPPQILPPPRLVAQTLAELVSSGELLVNTGISLARVAAGFLAGALLGLGLGAAMGLSRRIEQYVHPLFN